MNWILDIHQIPISIQYPIGYFLKYSHLYPKRFWVDITQFNWIRYMDIQFGWTNLPSLLRGRMVKLRGGDGGR